MKPSIGRIVHFVARDGKHLPAIIVSVRGELVSLQVFLDGNKGMEWRDYVRFDDVEQMTDTWHWPERVE